MPTFPDTPSDSVHTTNPQYTPDQIATHNTDSDCWLQIHDKVYDVTKYLDSHPGGAEVILDTAGGNATDMFEDIGHSKGARRQLAKFQVGVGEAMVGEGKNAVVAGVASGSGNQMVVLGVAIIGALLAIAVWGWVG